MISMMSNNLDPKIGTPSLMPRVIAHRGARQIAPENTIPALRAAKRIGATFAEVDVMLSADGVVFLSHDKTLERCR